MFLLHAVKPLFHFSHLSFLHPLFYSKFICTISNITDSFIDVKVTLHDRTGNILTDNGSKNSGNVTSYYDLISYDDNISDGTASLQLSSNATVIFNYQAPSSDHFGYGTIEWEQETTNNIVGLTSSCVIQYNNGNSSERSVSINGDMPF